MERNLNTMGDDTRDLRNDNIKVNSGGSRISRVGGGGVDLRRGCFLVKMCVKTKELGPMGGGMHPAHPPRSTNGKD